MVSDSASRRVLVLGEALIDIVDSGAGAAAEHVGGSPANVAIGVARLGHDTRLCTRIGRDARGERIAAHLAASGVGIAEASWTDRPTDTARARIGTDGAATYTFDIGEDLAVDGVDAAALVHTGSIALFRGPGGEACLAALREAAGRAIVTVDPNIRPDLVGGREAARARVAEAAAVADLVKLSDEDAAWLWPEASLDDVLELVAGLGARVAVITRGGEGAVGRAADGVHVSVPGRAVEVVDTIGAGDSFMSSLIATAIERGVPAETGALRQALERAAAAAAITVSRAGANPPTTAELDARA